MGKISLPVSFINKCIFMHKSLAKQVKFTDAHVLHQTVLVPYDSRKKGTWQLYQFELYLLKVTLSEKKNSAANLTSL